MSTTKQDADHSPLTAESAVAMLAFSAASSSLLLVNKLCIHLIPTPSFISAAQFIFCTLFIVCLKVANITFVDDFEWPKVKPYLYYILMFVSTIYCNMKALQHSNVETIIVFRACCPLVVSLLDYAFLGRALPSASSTFALLLLVAGAAGYVVSDAEFQLNGWVAYSWVTCYFFIISIEMAYGKYIVGSHLGFKSMWGPTLYTNALSIFPMLAIGFLTHEQNRVESIVWSVSASSLLLISCVIGVAISFTGWYCRSLVTATCYTVLGVANKMLTVLANLMLWDKHASAAGILSLVVCLLGAAMYKQAPMRREDSKPSCVHVLVRSPTVQRAAGIAALLLMSSTAVFALTHQSNGDAQSSVGVSTTAALPLQIKGGAHPHGHRDPPTRARHSSGEDSHAARPHNIDHAYPKKNYSHVAARGTTSGGRLQRGLKGNQTHALGLTTMSGGMQSGGMRSRRMAGADPVDHA